MAARAAANRQRGLAMTEIKPIEPAEKAKVASQREKIASPAPNAASSCRVWLLFRQCHFRTAGTRGDIAALHLYRAGRGGIRFSPAPWIGLNETYSFAEAVFDGATAEAPLALAVPHRQRQKEPFRSGTVLFAPSLRLTAAHSGSGPAAHARTASAASRSGSQWCSSDHRPRPGRA